MDLINVAHVLAAAEHCYRERMLRDAEQLYHRVLALAPGNMMARLGVAVIYGDEGRTEDAIAEIEHCRRLSGDDPFFLGPLSQLHASLNMNEDALHEASAYLRAFPGDAAGLKVVALASLQLGRYTNAEEVLQSLIKRRPMDADVWANLGCVYWAMGRTADARATWAAGLKQCPTDRLLAANLNTSDDDPDCRPLLAAILLGHALRSRQLQTWGRSARRRR